MVDLEKAIDQPVDLSRKTRPTKAWSTFDPTTVIRMEILSETWDKIRTAFDKSLCYLLVKRRQISASSSLATGKESLRNTKFGAF